MRYISLMCAGPGLDNVLLIIAMKPLLGFLFLPGIKSLVTKHWMIRESDLSKLQWSYPFNDMGFVVSLLVGISIFINFKTSKNNRNTCNNAKQLPGFYLLKTSLTF